MKFKILVVMKNITCTGFIASVIIQKWFCCRETHKLNTIDTEYRASISLWRLKAFLVINFSIYEGRKIIFCQKTFGKVGTFQSLGKVGTCTSWLCQTQMNVKFIWVLTWSTGTCRSIFQGDTPFHPTFDHPTIWI